MPTAAVATVASMCASLSLLLANFVRILVRILIVVIVIIIVIVAVVVPYYTYIMAGENTRALDLFDPWHITIHVPARIL